MKIQRPRPLVAGKRRLDENLDRVLTRWFRRTVWRLPGLIDAQWRFFTTEIALLALFGLFATWQTR